MLNGLINGKKESYSRYIAQAPQPIVEIVEFNPSLGNEIPVIDFSAIRKSPIGKAILADNDEQNVLQGYSFKFSTSDTEGSFTLTLHPGNADKPYFDKIKPLQIVKIYERDNTGRTPDFVGVINRKKFVAQPGSGLRISITGKSVASFISRFKISLDLNAMAITEQLESQQALSTALTASLAEGKILKVSEVLKKIWEYSKDCASKCIKLSNPAIEKYVEKYLGSNFFSFDEEMELSYPLSSVFNGQNTIMFWDIVSGIIPFPVYERFAFIDEKGKTKIKIREVPFDCSGDGLGFSSWDKLEKNKTELDPAIVKGFDFDVSDDEVYTAFFSYVIGSPIEQDKALRLAAQTGGFGNEKVEIYNKKAAIYGYSPLTVNFNGYGTKEKTASDPEKSSAYDKLNKRLMNWYGHLEEMLKGTITISTIVNKEESKDEKTPMCGEIVSFLGGEFYVNEVEHTWNFGGNPETKLTVSRGGNYEKKKFAPLEGITKRYVLFKKLLDTAKAKGINIL